MISTNYYWSPAGRLEAKTGFNNLTEAVNTQTFTYNQRNQVLSIANSGSGITPDATRTFVYNGVGRMVSMVDGTAQPSFMAWDGVLAIHERNDGSTARYRWGLTGLVEFIQPDLSRSNPTTDASGNVRKLLGSATNEYFVSVSGEREAAAEPLGSTVPSLNRVQAGASYGLLRLSTASEELYTDCFGETELNRPDTCANETIIVPTPEDLNRIRGGNKSGIADAPNAGRGHLHGGEGQNYRDPPSKIPPPLPEDDTDLPPSGGADGPSAGGLGAGVGGVILKSRPRPPVTTTPTTPPGVGSGSGSGTGVGSGAGSGSEGMGGGAILIPLILILIGYKIAAETAEKDEQARAARQRSNRDQAREAQKVYPDPDARAARKRRRTATARQCCCEYCGVSFGIYKRASLPSRYDHIIRAEERFARHSFRSVTVPNQMDCNEGCTLWGKPRWNPIVEARSHWDGGEAPVPPYTFRGEPDRQWLIKGFEGECDEEGEVGDPWPWWGEVVSTKGEKDLRYYDNGYPRNYPWL